MSRFGFICAALLLAVACSLGSVSAMYLNVPVGLTVDASGSIYVANNGNGQITSVNLDGTVKAVIATIPGVWGIAWRQSDNSLICTANSKTLYVCTRMLRRVHPLLAFPHSPHVPALCCCLFGA
jgi:DNA-binding beta-propeller fold protein YncE